MLGKIKIFAVAHKTATWVTLIVVIFGGYYGYKKFTGSKTVTSYVLSAVEKGTIVTSVSGTGQVSSLDQIDVKPKGSGDVVYVSAKNGQEVKAGQILFQLDTTDAQKALTNAQLDLNSANITLQKFKVDQGDTQVSRTVSLKNSYASGLNQISSAFTSLVDVMNGVYNVLYGDTVKGGCTPNVCQYGNYIQDINQQRVFISISGQAKDDYATAKASYDLALNKYHDIRLVDLSNDDLRSMLDTTSTTLNLIAQSIKSEQNMLDTLVADIKGQSSINNGSVTVPIQITTYQSDLAGFASTVGNNISGISGSINSIDTGEQSITSSKIGDPLDLANQENVVSQKEAALSDAKQNLANLYVRAPFAGVVTKITVQKGDSVSTGTTMATLIADQSITQISLNEVDISKIKIGQKATLTFDAIDGLTIVGDVIEIDAIGTVSQGVVTYNVKIVFDTQDDRIKPGMSVSAAIVTDSKADVLLVPNSAIKSLNIGSSYVLMPQDQASAAKAMASNTSTTTGIILSPAPSQQMVGVGLANDTMTEITSGLKEGDLVVTQTKTGTSTTSTTTGTTGGGALRIPGLGGGGGFRGGN